MRVSQFARLLPEAGWDVTVLTARHVGSDALDTGTESLIGQYANVVRSWSPSAALWKRGRVVPRHGARAKVRQVVRTAATSLVFPDREVFWTPGAIRAGQRTLHEQRHDVVLASYGPASNLLVGTALARAARLPLVVDFRDLWSTMPMPVFPTTAHRAAAHSLEGAIVRRASRLLAVSPGMAADLAREHRIQPQHAISITNGFDPRDVTRVRDERESGPRPFRLVYSGTVHVHYNMEPLWRAVRTLADAGTITPQSLRLEFVGNLAPTDVARHGLESFVEIRPYVPHDEVFDVLARADALLVVETPGYYARNGYAAKVFDYVLTGKPVVGLVEAGGNTELLLRASGVGHCVEPHDADGLMRVLVDVMKLHGAPPRPVDPDSPPLRDFNREHLVRALASILDDVVDTEPQGRW